MPAEVRVIEAGSPHVEPRRDVACSAWRYRNPLTALPVEVPGVGVTVLDGRPVTHDGHVADIEVEDGRAEVREVVQAEFAGFTHAVLVGRYGGRRREARPGHRPDHCACCEDRSPPSLCLGRRHFVSPIWVPVRPELRDTNRPISRSRQTGRNCPWHLGRSTPFGRPSCTRTRCRCHGSSRTPSDP
jgi:hypothetical protein